MFSPGQLTVWGDPLEKMIVHYTECPECGAMDKMDCDKGCPKPERRPVTKSGTQFGQCTYLKWLKKMRDKLIAKRNTVVKTDEIGYVALFDKGMIC